MKKLLIFAVSALATISLGAQNQAEGYKFTDTKVVKNTPVKNQASSGTCWSFSGISFLESEIMRAGGPELDLADMWVVRHAYETRAERYVRMHGNANCSAGGAFCDVFNTIKKYGIVPENEYLGLNYGTDQHKHAELDALVKAYVGVIVKAPMKTLTPVWKQGLAGVFDAYLGECPETFTVDGKEYTPTTYAESLGINMDDYISITSYTHHPFYTQFAIEVPDNTQWGLSYNLPIDEFMAVIDNALNNGYSIAWGADVSDPGFAWRKGFAVVPDADTESMEGTELSRWVALTPAEKQRELYKLDKPGKEKTITQEMRQVSFDNYETTDDHGMHIVGLATDQNGTEYYKVKNSWGTGDHIYGGYFYASKPYVALRTLNYVVNKNALPKDIKKKLGIK
ncbi:MAG: aminopeptidase [Rikenellaceae bacterium]|nr:aminopeptidase [Rikenellaceae bacterium]